MDANRTSADCHCSPDLRRIGHPPSRGYWQSEMLNGYIIRRSVPCKNAKACKSYV